MQKELKNNYLVPMVSSVKNFYPVDESLATNGSGEKCQNIFSAFCSRERLTFGGALFGGLN